MSAPVVVDTNILFSSLVSGGRSAFTHTLRESRRRFVAGELLLTELFKHKERIVAASRLTDDEVVLLFYNLMRELEFFKEDLISSENRKKAYALCKDIDETDAPHVALALELEGLLWTGDEKLRRGLETKGFTRFFDPRSE